MRHTPGVGACGGTIIAAFIDRGSADGLDVSCVQEQKPAAFAIAPQNRAKETP